MIGLLSADGGIRDETGPTAGVSGFGTSTFGLESSAGLVASLVGFGRSAGLEGSLSGTFSKPAWPSNNAGRDGASDGGNSGNPVIVPPSTRQQGAVIGLARSL